MHAQSETDGEGEAAAAFLAALDDEAKCEPCIKEVAAAAAGGLVLTEVAEAIDSDAEPKQDSRREVYMWNWSNPTPQQKRKGKGAKSPGDQSAKWFYEEVLLAHAACDQPRLAYGACAKEKHAEGTDGQRHAHMHCCTKARAPYSFKRVKLSRGAGLWYLRRVQDRKVQLPVNSTCQRCENFSP